MSKKQRNKDTRPAASAVIGDGAIDASASAVLRNPPVDGKPAAKPKSAAKQKSASKQKQDAFSIWLDRALPRLQDRLAETVSIDVTAASDKLKI
ncbi:MAG: hypothetical protein ACK4FJ_02735 [Ferrovibrio sp.]|uniref:hypothetical protein n=1 Tax=Ferrovibrio sp. TaxID=1917215 RepID=UPI003919E57D